ncbi:MAG: DUF499 domain-containing protein [Nocardioides sp.]|uniref:DUF499 domain-containing protein n=1 Tax=Nocardioides sp. TaxID=35761 RepID=UPI0039E6A98C
MATSNRERIGQLFETLGPVLGDFITGTIAPEIAADKSWTDIFVAVSRSNHPVEGRDPSIQLKFLAENYPGRFKRGWQPFKASLGRIGEAYAGELLQVRHAWAHMKSFTDDDAYRALDTAERLLISIGAPDAADRVAKIRLDLRRITADKDDRRTLRSAAATNPDSAGLRPWREVLQPHEDVATGNFHASEFAADLYKVASGDPEQGRDYADPIEFFRRTYLTEGLKDLISRAARRLSGDDNASPVVNLQTNFGGGKTHSMLSLWHLAGGTAAGEYPQEVQELLTAAGGVPSRVNRVAIVGNHFSPAGSVKPDGTQVNTIWGELAWQLGGRAAYDVVADADRKRTPPGAALHELLAAYAPAVILIDEWVAYARSLVGRHDLAAGTFDDQFTFAQSLTEAAKGTPGILLAISIPASDVGPDGTGPGADGNAEEVGGANGMEALKRLQNVVRRVADQWRPASSDEAYHIVRQRLFVTPDAAALAAIGATAKAFVDLYRKHPGDFPRETRDAGYEERIKHTYPVHPELFDRLYEDWSSLERFQRTRGVLRLMNAVIHALWVGQDAGALILPGSIPIQIAAVNTELTQYLPDQWKAIIDADVDGANSEPVRIDTEKPVFGTRSLTRRLARTVFFGAAPTIGSAHKGIETQRVFLGVATPGDVPGNFHSALTQLGDRATYFYSGQGKYWYDLQANISRRAKDQAERMHLEDVWAEIVRRLGVQNRSHGDFAAVHVCPEETGDIPDVDEARLVILHPKHRHSRKASDTSARTFATKATEAKGSGHRRYRNMVVFLAADTDRMGEVVAAVRDYLGWASVLASHDLDLTQNQRNQAEEKRGQADSTVEARLLGAYQWALVPEQPDPGAPFVIAESKVDGASERLAERVSRRLGNDGQLNTRQAAINIKMAIARAPRIWESGHVSVGELWELFASYAYLPRLRDQSVLNAGVVDQPMLWTVDGFAVAESYDGQRYVGLVPGSEAGTVAITNSVLLVRPDVAEAQLAEERAQAADPADPDGPDDPDGADGTDGADGVTGAPATSSRPDVSWTPAVELHHRFFGVKELDPQRYAVDFKKIVDEVLAHLVADGVDLQVRIEISATARAGFDEARVRTVSENATTLRFETSGFEKE